MVAVRTAERRERLAAINAPEERRVLHVYDIRVLRVSVDMAIVERSLANGAARVPERPAAARIVALEQAAALVLNECVHAIRVRGAGCDSDASNHAVREPRCMRDLRP